MRVCVHANCYSMWYKFTAVAPCKRLSVTFPELASNIKRHERNVIFLFLTPLKLFGTRQPDFLLSKSFGYCLWTHNTVRVIWSENRVQRDRFVSRMLIFSTFLLINVVYSGDYCKNLRICLRCNSHLKSSKNYALAIMLIGVKCFWVTFHLKARRAFVSAYCSVCQWSNFQASLVNAVLKNMQNYLHSISLKSAKSCMKRFPDRVHIM